MPCEDAQSNLSLLVDGELGSAGQHGLFAHLETCAKCRSFLTASLSLRAMAREDRDVLLREADEALPLRLARRAAAPARTGFAGWSIAGERLVPALAFACGVAGLLLVAGVFIGARLAPRGTRQAAPHPATQVSAPAERATGEPRVVYLCSLPEYLVRADAVPGITRQP